MGRLTEAVDDTVEALGAKVQPEDRALVVALSELAAAVEESPGRAALWEAFLEALGQLRSVGDGDDEFARLLEEINRDPVVGDSPAA